jgi:FMN reductase
VTSTVVVVGNPRLGSRTRQAAELVVERLTGEPPHRVIELAELGPALLSWDDPAVAEAKQTVLDADLLVVASPVFKASFTGLLKLFLDHFDAGALAGKPTVPLMLGGSAAHTLAAEVHLKPVLSEIGASCPTPALFLLDVGWETSPVLEGWLPAARAVLGLRTG